MRNFIIILLCVLIISCSQKEKVDTIIHHAKVYSVDDDFKVQQAFAIQNGKFMEVASDEEILSKYTSENIIDAGGKPIYPGFIDAHCHFFGYGKSLGEVDLVGTRSFHEVIAKIVQHHKKYKSEWITGRGWDQNDWEVKEFPQKDTLDKLFPATPVYVRRIDGHAAIANQAALDAAAITPETKVYGGEIEIIGGKLTGILVDKALDIVKKIVPSLNIAGKVDALLDAQKNCFEVGLTTVDDAGIDKEIVDLIDSLQTSGVLKMRVYAMLNPSEENKDHYFRKGKYKTDRLNVRSFKIYADGALGSRGACLMESYTDKPGHIGFMLESKEFYELIAKQTFEHGFQLNTHCIGDSANRYMLRLYANYLQPTYSSSITDTNKLNRRWRIEHAQVINEEDFKLFGSYWIIASIQPTHATSDMYWAGDRLGPVRIKGAYAYDRFPLIAIGSDFPVEHINPLYGFYAAVARKDLKGYPEDGFQMENALTRKRALEGMTIMAAYANFEENEKGSIEVGKFADFVILEDDIMELDESLIPMVKVVSTYVGGEKVY